MHKKSVIHRIVFETEIGTLYAAEDGNGICMAGFWSEEENPAAEEKDAAEENYEEETVWEEETPLLAEARRQLTEYAQGKRREFSLPLSLHGTPFQKKIWAALQTIPYGETRTYGQIAAQTGNPKASRAVGMANHNNPVAIIVPCHRVIGAGGKLTGYAGGLDKKERLLELEMIGSISRMAAVLQLPQELTDALLSYARRDAGFIKILYGRNRRKDDLEGMVKETIKNRGDDGYLALLAFALFCAGDTERFYDQNRIDRSVFLDTMSDIAIWCGNCQRKNNALGLENINWLKHHFKPDLFRLGRLQFQICKMYLPDYVKEDSLKPFHLKCGDDVLFIHVPQGERLSYNKCRESFEYAKEFFRDHFPALNFQFGICESWLLYSKNARYMGKDSNILKFAEGFTLLGETPEPEQAIQRIWGSPQADIRDYAEKTSLQKAAKEYLKQGGSLGKGFGIVEMVRLQEW